MPRGGARPGAGRPRKPVELKEWLGNPGKRALPQVQRVLPSTVDANGLPVFTSGAALLQYVLDNGARAWISPTDIGSVMLRDLYDDWLLARAAWRAEPGGDRERKTYELLAKLVVVQINDLCLTPGKRSGLGLAVVKAAAKVDEMEERRRAILNRPS